MALIVTASDIESEQARTLASANATDLAVQSCTTLDDGTKAQWALFLAELRDFCSRPVCNFWYPWMPSNCLMATASTGDTMVAHEAQLVGWQGRINPKCTNAPPGLTPYNPTPAGEAVTQWLKYGAVIAGFVGSAYVVSQVVPFVAALRPAPKKLPEKKT